MLENAGTIATASVVVSDGKGVYLVKRSRGAFIGMWALPGGKLNCGKETLEEAAIRELREETSIIVGEKDLSILAVNSKPDRDPRGHYIDHVFIALEFRGEPKAGDDASEVKYFEFGNLPPLAFDHDKNINILLKQLELFKLIHERIKK